MGIISLTISIAIFFASLLNPLSILIAIPILALTIAYPKLILPTLFIIGATFSNHFQIFIFTLFLAYQAGVRKINLRMPSGSKYFFVVLAAWAAIEFYQQVNLEQSVNYFRNYNFLLWSSYLKTEYHHLIQTVTIFSNLCLIIISYKFFKLYQLKDFKTGLILAVVLLQTLTAYQIFIDPFVFGNQNNFWLMQLRFSGTFTDPNAFALGSFLIIGFLLFLFNQDRSDKKLLLFVAIQIWLTLYSGSRTFFLAIFLCLLCWAFLKSKKLFLTTILTVLLTFLLLNLLFIADSFNTASIKILPASISRVLTSLNIGYLSETFFSRQVFNELNFLIFKDYPIFGVGLNQFDQFLPNYQNSLSSNIGRWVDNNNNFYFGLLSELGILGILCFLSLINCFRFDFTKSKILIVFCFVFLSLLLLGPHFYFTEVSLLFGLLLSQVAKENISTTKNHQVLFGIALCFLVIFGTISNSRFRTIGLYQEEQDDLGSFHWSKREARIFLDCSIVSELTLQEFRVEAKIQDLQISRLEKIPFLNQKFTKLELNSGKFFCPDDQSKFQINLKLSGAWQPFKIIPVSNDQRSLGVKVRFSPFGTQKFNAHNI